MPVPEANSGVAGGNAPRPKRLLILGGTAEAAELARKAADIFQGRLDVISSLAGRTSNPPALAGRVRVGGFGGALGLEDYLRQESIDWVIDATHPFAETISDHAYAACLCANVPRVMLIRPLWRLPPMAPWVEVEDLARAAEVLPRMSRRAFLTTGIGGIEAFAKVKKVWFLVRLIEAPEKPLPLALCALITGRPPFSLESERALLALHRIDTLVSKHSGGRATESKIRAALEANVKVILIRRPPKPPGDHAESADEIIAWLGRQL